jgi:hypothetical protein
MTCRSSRENSLAPALAELVLEAEEALSRIAELTPGPAYPPAHDHAIVKARVWLARYRELSER